MAVDFRRISHNLMELECYRRYTTHTLLRNSGIYFGQPPILEYLVRHGTCTQNEIAKAMNVSPASMAVSIKRMQKSGLVERVIDEKDMRCNKVSISEKGRELVQLIDSRFAEMDRKIYAGFTEDELEAFNGYIERMNHNLAKDAPDKKHMFEIMKNEFRDTSGGDSE